MSEKETPEDLKLLTSSLKEVNKILYDKVSTTLKPMAFSSSSTVQTCFS